MRLIDADELISEFACRLDDSVESIPTKNIIRFIESAYSVDAVPVVRCKNCEYWSESFCTMSALNTHALFYCAIAERKTESE